DGPHARGNLAIVAERDVHRPTIVRPIRDYREAVGRGAGKGAKEHRVHRAENRRARADAEGECRHRYDGEAGTPRESPHCVAQVSDRREDEVLPAIRPDLLPSDRHVADLELRGATSLRFGHASRGQFGGRLVRVVTKLVGEIVVGRAAMHEHTRAAGEMTPERHVTPPISEGGLPLTYVAPSLPSRPRAASIPRA